LICVPRSRPTTGDPNWDNWDIGGCNGHRLEDREAPRQAGPESPPPRMRELEAGRPVSMLECRLHRRPPAGTRRPPPPPPVSRGRGTRHDDLLLLLFVCCLPGTQSRRSAAQPAAGGRQGRPECSQFGPPPQSGRQAGRLSRQKSGCRKQKQAKGAPPSRGLEHEKAPRQVQQAPALAVRGSHRRQRARERARVRARQRVSL
jgi:hypothetical protein